MKQHAGVIWEITDERLPYADNLIYVEYWSIRSGKWFFEKCQAAFARVLLYNPKDYSNVRWFRECPVVLASEVDTLRSQLAAQAEVIRLQGQEIRELKAAYLKMYNLCIEVIPIDYTGDPRVIEIWDSADKLIKPQS